MFQSPGRGEMCVGRNGCSFQAKNREMFSRLLIGDTLCATIAVSNIESRQISVPHTLVLKYVKKVPDHTSNSVQRRLPLRMFGKELDLLQPKFLVKLFLLPA